MNLTHTPGDADTMQRPLGVSEKLMYKMRDYGGLNACSVTHLDGDLDKARLKRAMNRVVAENPILRSTVVRKPGPDGDGKAENDELCFIQDDDESNFDEHTFSDIDDLHAHLSKEIGIKMPENGRLWRLSVARLEDTQDAYFLITKFDHTIIDGKSTYRLIEKLLNAYEQDVPSDTPVKENISTPSEQFVQHKLTLANIIRFMAHEGGKMFFPLTPTVFAATAPFAERRTCFVNLSLSSDLTGSLQKKAREHNTTMHGVIVAAVLFSIAKHLCEPSKKYRFCNATPIDLRGDFNISEALLGNYSSAVESVHTIKPETRFWSLAEEIRDKVVLNKSRDLHLSSILLFEFFQRFLSENFRIKLLEGKQMGRLATSNVSNLGKIDLKENYGNLRIEGFSAAVGQHGFGASISLAPLTFKGALSFNIQYIEPLNTLEQAQALRDSITDLASRSLDSNSTFEEFASL